MHNPVNLRTRRACGVLGALVRGWAQMCDGQLPEYFRREDARTFVIDALAFREILRGAGLRDGTAEPDEEPDETADFWLRADVTEVELLARVPGRGTLLLPEADVIAEQEKLAPGDTVLIPDFYFDGGSGASRTAPDTPAIDQGDIEAFGPVTMGQNPLRSFLDPYLAAYLCTQCK